MTTLAALLLMAAGLQTADAQGFRVYKSDGTVAQFSMRTDSIVFYEGIGSDVEFGPFTPVNQCIAGTWYKSKTESVTFSEDGTTDYIAGATYEFLPYQGTIVIYNFFGAPVNILKVHKVGGGQMLVSDLSGKYSKETYFLLNNTPTQLVTGIILNETSLKLSTDETKRLTATIEPTDADNTAVVWESSNEAVAQVINNGLVLAVGGGLCTITCRATDHSGIYAECKVKVYNEYQGATDGHEWVDLGLPSHTLWATCNVGADYPEDYGYYLAWGETEPKSDYTTTTYKFYNQGYTKYCTDSSKGTVDNKTELEPDDDAATVNWGANWQMPSLAQCQELVNSDYTSIVWTTQNGVIGYLYTSKINGESIFMPAPGYYRGTTLENKDAAAYYWSRELDTDDNRRAWHIFANITSSNARYLGWHVRPVRKQ